MKLRNFLMLLAGVSLCLTVISGPAHAAKGGGGGDDLESEAEFEWMCAQGGGRFHRRADTGAITCWYDDGTVVYCDKGAKNCGTIHPNKPSDESSTAPNSQGPSQASSGYGSSPNSAPKQSNSSSNAPSRPRR